MLNLISTASSRPAGLSCTGCHQSEEDHQQSSARGSEGHRTGAQRDPGIRVQRCDGSGGSWDALWRHMQGLPGLQSRWGTTVPFMMILAIHSKINKKNIYIYIKKKSATQKFGISKIFYVFKGVSSAHQGIGKAYIKIENIF